MPASRSSFRLLPTSTKKSRASTAWCTRGIGYLDGARSFRDRSETDNRAIIYYPQQLGRNIDELVRVFQGLQTIDGNGVSVGADWQPGQDVIVPAPATLADAAKRTNGGGAGLKVETW